MGYIVGTVTGLKEISPYDFWIRVNSEQRVPGLDDIVRVDYEWNGTSFRTYGIITEIVTQWDGTVSTGYQEESCSEGIYRGIPIYLGRVVVTRVLAKNDSSYLTVTPVFPPPVGQKMELVEPAESSIALGFDVIRKGKREVPVGLLSNGEVAYLDLKYLLGDNGAHVNVSGQSGVAAKTSYATFLLWMLKNYGTEKLQDRSLTNCRSVIFNVKGEGLLFLDHWNREWIDAQKGSDEDRRRFAEWSKIFRTFDLKPHPFENVSVNVPPRDYSGEPSLSHHRPGVRTFGWDTLDIIELGLLPLLFDPEELAINPNHQLVVSVIEDVLRDRYDKFLDDARRELTSRSYRLFRISADGLDNKSLLLSYLQAANEDSKIILGNFGIPNGLSELIDLLRLEPDEETVRTNLTVDLLKEQVDNRTILAISRRLRTARRTGLNLLWRTIDVKPSPVITTPIAPYQLDWNRPGGVTVIDISKLHARAQTFVVGAVLKEIMYRKEQGCLNDPVFVYLDELNKYAPRTGGGPLASIFRDVAERGRSFRVVLIGAEQTASQVDYRVVTQAATIAVGRQKYAELSKEEYAHLSGALREKAATLLPGEVIIDQPFLRLPITIKFPLTPWATSEDSRENQYTGQEEQENARSSSPQEELRNLLE
ncbi:MAG: ATP-binding protein [Candidatus Atribacteria bacterium]|nr:ATP-binding protein [Candidatus Atribacteria bacterium]